MLAILLLATVNCQITSIVTAFFGSTCGIVVVIVLAIVVFCCCSFTCLDYTINLL